MLLEFGVLLVTLPTGTTFMDFFTSMFISNIEEANYFDFDTTPDIITSENIWFSTMINELLRKQIPYSQWVDILQKNAHAQHPFVCFNYEVLAYYE